MVVTNALRSDKTLRGNLFTEFVGNIGSAFGDVYKKRMTSVDDDKKKCAVENQLYLGCEKNWNYLDILLIYVKDYVCESYRMHRMRCCLKINYGVYGE